MSFISMKARRRRSRERVRATRANEIAVTGLEELTLHRPCHGNVLPYPAPHVGFRRTTSGSRGTTEFLIQLRTEYVLKSELSVSRLDKVVNQPCVDGLIHVHLPSVGLLEETSELMAHAVATGRLVDIAAFIRDTAIAADAR